MDVHINSAWLVVAAVLIGVSILLGWRFFSNHLVQQEDKRIETARQNLGRAGLTMWLSRMSADQIRSLQSSLRKRGYAIEVTGQYDEKMVAILESEAVRKNLDLTKATLDTLESHIPRDISPEEREALVIQAAQRTLNSGEVPIVNFRRRRA